MTLGYVVELAKPHPDGRCGHYDWCDILTEEGATFIFLDLVQAVNAARDYQRRNPQHDGWVRVNGFCYRLYPTITGRIRVWLNGHIALV